MPVGVRSMMNDKERLEELQMVMELTIEALIRFQSLFSSSAKIDYVEMLKSIIFDIELLVNDINNVAVPINTNSSDLKKIIDHWSSIDMCLFGQNDGLKSSFFNYFDDYNSYVLHDEFSMNDTWVAIDDVYNAFEQTNDVVSHIMPRVGLF